MKHSLSLLCSISVFGLLILGFFHPITAMTQDLGRHLLTGKIIFQTHAVPQTNLFSYTFTDFPFINHHWLSEVIFYLISQISGLNGLLVFSTSIVCLAYSFVFFYRFKKPNILAVSIGSLLYLPILFERTDVRPEIFSFLFVSIFLVILYRYSEKFTKLIFLLPLLELLWVNMHIYFPIGILLIGLFIIDMGIIHRNYLKSKYVLSLTIVFLLTIGTTLCNPNGMDGALYPLKVFTNYGYQIEENQNIFFLLANFQAPSIPYFVISVFFLFTSLFLTIRKTKPVDWLLALSFSLIGALAIRNFPLFVFATFIPLTKSLSIIIHHVSRALREKFSQHYFTFTFVTFIVFFVAFFSQLQSVVQTKPPGMGEIAGAKHAVNFFLAHKLTGPIFNNFDIGSYLEYRLYPKEKVFVDGRPEAYPADFFQKIYIPMQEDPETFTAIDHRYTFNTVFFAHTDQTPWAGTFLKTLLENPNWTTVYLDDTVIIFVRKNAQNKQLIATFGMNKNQLHGQNAPMNFQSLLQLASFFSKVNMQDQEIIVLKKIIATKPDYCPALQPLATFLMQENDATATIYSARYQNSCQ